MTDPRLALRLREAGLTWHPAPGDRFFLPYRDMDDEVFVLSDMTVEVHEFPTGRVIGFNGVTEWALDSVDVQEAVWVPAEHQLRDLLGPAFLSLAQGADGFTVTVRNGSHERRYTCASAPDAYAQALLGLLVMLRS